MATVEALQTVSLEAEDVIVYEDGINPQTIPTNTNDTKLPVERDMGVISALEEETKSVKESQKKTTHVGFIVAIILLTLIIIAIIACAILLTTTDLLPLNFKKPNRAEKAKELSEKILPNTTLTVFMSNTSDLIGEIQIVDDEMITTWNFQSNLQDNSDKYVEFMYAGDYDGDQNMKIEVEEFLHGYQGFAIEVFNNTLEEDGVAMHFYFYKFTLANPIEFRITPTSQGILDRTTVEDLFREVFSSHVGEYFVELSIKLGGNGYIGSMSQPIMIVHTFARRILMSLNQLNADMLQWKNFSSDVHNMNIFIEFIYNNAYGDKLRDEHRYRPDDHKGDVSQNFSNNTSTKQPESGEEGGKNNQNDGKYRSKRSLLGACNVQYPQWIGDGYCDRGDYNTAECNFDGGDCCPSSCNDAAYTCGVVGWECKCDVQYIHWLGDGYCDKNSNYNTESCGYDGGDCCEATCLNNAYTCGANGYDCKSCNVANPNWIGDGWCDGGTYNTVECGWDGGDCCEYGCQSSTYTCGVAGYDCLAPGGCVQINACGNPCIGRCGENCECWESVCGPQGCICDSGCFSHDLDCSCGDWWDVLWGCWVSSVVLTCDDGSSVALNTLF